MFNINKTNITILHSNYSSRILDRLEVKILFVSIMIILCLITTIGNLIVIYNFGRKRNSVGNLFIVSLAIADLIVGAFVMPIASIYSFSEKWNFSLVLCQIWLGADYTASTASILNLLTLSLDRYWSITSPLKYLSKRTKSRALCMIGIVWFISLLWIIPITTWPYIANNGIRIVQSDECDTEYKHNLAFKLITALFNFYVPLIAMIAINAKIYLVIRQRYRSPMMQYTSGPFLKANWSKSNPSDSHSDRNKNSRNSIKKSYLSETKLSCDSGLLSLNYNINDLKRKFSMSSLNDDSSELNQNSTNDSSQTPKKKVSIVQLDDLVDDKETKLKKISFKDRISVHLTNKLSRAYKANQAFFNKQEKAFGQLAAIVIGFTLCFTPYFVIFLVVALCKNCVNNNIFEFALWLGYLNSTINPFLYALSSHRWSCVPTKNNKKLQKK